MLLNASHSVALSRFANADRIRIFSLLTVQLDLHSHSIVLRYVNDRDELTVAFATIRMQAALIQLGEDGRLLFYSLTSISFVHFMFATWIFIINAFIAIPYTCYRPRSG